jgi:hypothetical protein
MQLLFLSSQYRPTNSHCAENAIGRLVLRRVQLAQKEKKKKKRQQPLQYTFSTERGRTIASCQSSHQRDSSESGRHGSCHSLSSIIIPNPPHPSIPGTEAGYSKQGDKFGCPGSVTGRTDHHYTTPSPSPPPMILMGADLTHIRPKAKTRTAITTNTRAHIPKY